MPIPTHYQYQKDDYQKTAKTLIPKKLLNELTDTHEVLGMGVDIRRYSFFPNRKSMTTYDVRFTVRKKPTKGKKSDRVFKISFFVKDSEEPYGLRGEAEAHDRIEKLLEKSDIAVKCPRLLWQGHGIIVYEWKPLERLDEYFQRRPQKKRLLKIGRALGEYLALLHDNKIYDTDFGPHNIFIKYRQKEEIYVTDFKFPGPIPDALLANRKLRVYFNLISFCIKGKELLPIHKMEYFYSIFAKTYNEKKKGQKLPETYAEMYKQLDKEFQLDSKGRGIGFF